MKWADWTCLRRYYDRQWRASLGQVSPILWSALVGKPLPMYEIASLASHVVTVVGKSVSGFTMPENRLREAGRPASWGQVFKEYDGSCKNVFAEFQLDGHF